MNQPLAIGTVLLERYKIQKVLTFQDDRGTYEATRRGNRWFVKELCLPDGWGDRMGATHADYTDTLKLLVSMRHDHLARVHEFFHVGRREYVVLELLDGQSLADRLASDPVDPATAAVWIGAVCEGLRALHHPHPYVFGPLTADHVMLTRDGRIKLVNYGLSRFLLPAPHPRIRTADKADLKPDFVALGHLLSQLDSRPAVAPLVEALLSGTLQSETDVQARLAEVLPLEEAPAAEVAVANEASVEVAPADGPAAEAVAGEGAAEVVAAEAPAADEPAAEGVVADEAVEVAPADQPAAEVVVADEAVGVAPAEEPAVEVAVADEAPAHEPETAEPPPEVVQPPLPEPAPAEPKVSRLKSDTLRTFKPAPLDLNAVRILQPEVSKASPLASTTVPLAKARSKPRPQPAAAPSVQSRALPPMPAYVPLLRAWQRFLRLSPGMVAGVTALVVAGVLIGIHRVQATGHFRRAGSAILVTFRDSVSVVDAGTGQTLFHRDLPGGARASTLMNHGNILLIDDRDGQHVLAYNTHRNDILRTIALPVAGSDLYGDGHFACLASETARQVYAFARNGLSLSGEAAVPRRPEAVVETQNGGFFVSTGDYEQIILVARKGRGGTIGCSGGPSGMAVAKGNRELWVACQRNDEVKVVNLRHPKLFFSLQQRLVADIKPIDGSGPTALLMAPDGLHAYVMCPGSDSISILDAVHYKLEKVVQLPGEPVAWSFAGPNELVVGTQGARLVVVDLTSGTISGTFPLATDPVGVAYAP